MLEASDTVFNFDVIRCKFAETIKAMSLGHIGQLMACNRDGTFCQGYDPRSPIMASARRWLRSGESRLRFNYLHAMLKCDGGGDISVATRGCDEGGGKWQRI